MKRSPGVARTLQGLSLIAVGGMLFFSGMAFQKGRLSPMPVEAASGHLYELMVYHALPGKATALETIFRDVSHLQAQHGLHAIGYWVPKDNDPAWRDTFVYLLVHADRQSAEANWKALHADPAFKPFRAAAAPLIQQKDGDFLVDEIYMSPTKYSDFK